MTKDSDSSVAEQCLCRVNGWENKSKGMIGLCKQGGNNYGIGEKLENTMKTAKVSLPTFKAMKVGMFKLPSLSTKF